MNVVLFENSLMRIGSFTLEANDPEFNRAGHISNPHIVFPKNSIWIKHQGKQAFVADTSLVNLYNSQQVYNRFAINPRGDFCHWLELSPELIQQFSGRKNQALFTKENIHCSKQLYLQHLLLLSSICCKIRPEQIEIEEMVYGILSSIIELDDDHGNHESTTSQNKLVERIKQNINKDLSLNLSLKEIANQSYSSPFHICRAFKKHTGMGINQYRMQQRLRLVCLRLQGRQVDLAELALRYGFSSHSHLSACFKKYYNMTPTLYKRQLK